MEEGRKEKEEMQEEGGEKEKKATAEKKERKALLLSLSRLKSRNSLTWEPNLSCPPTTLPLWPPPPPTQTH